NVYIEHAVENLLGKEGFRSSLERDDRRGALRLKPEQERIVGAVLPLPRTADGLSLDSSEGLRRLIQQVRDAGQNADPSLVTLQLMDDVMEKAVTLEPRDDGWRAAVCPRGPGSGGTAIARIFKLDTGESALGVFISH